MAFPSTYRNVVVAYDGSDGALMEHPARVASQFEPARLFTREHPPTYSILGAKYGYELLRVSGESLPDERRVYRARIKPCRARGSLRATAYGTSTSLPLAAELSSIS